MSISVHEPATGFAVGPVPSRVEEPPGGFHQVHSSAAWALEPPGEVATTGPRLRRLGMSLTDDRSATVTTGLPLVIDLERLRPATLRISGAAPKRTIPTSSLHRVGATHLTPDDAGLDSF